MLSLVLEELKNPCDTAQPGTQDIHVQDTAVETHLRLSSPRCWLKLQEVLLHGLIHLHDGRHIPCNTLNTLHWNQMGNKCVCHKVLVAISLCQSASVAIMKQEVQSPHLNKST